MIISIKTIIIRLVLIIMMLLTCLTATGKSMTGLLKPAGSYGVGFRDFHWVNHDICPDPHFSEATRKDFGANNRKYCHELMVRIYYPTHLKTTSGSPWYPPLELSEQNRLKKIPGIKPEDLRQIFKIKSHTMENAPIVQKKRFPVILFSPGSGGQSQLYENIITNLVSHGYIVIGINALFINGDIALPNGTIVHPVYPESWDEVSQKTIPVLEKDIVFVYKKIHELSQDGLFKAINLAKIGGFGHSMGGRAIANVAKKHPEWFGALVTLDMEVHMGSYKPENPGTPFLHMISAYFRTLSEGQNIQYMLDKNGYLLTLAPDAKNIHYSYHMNFTDLSTLQYLPAWQVQYKQMVQAKNFGNYLGTGNGEKIIKSINLYLSNFFDAFLNSHKNPIENCKPLTVDTWIQCGPGKF